MSSRPSALSKHLAKSLAPEVKDTRKFRLAKPMVFNPEQAEAVAIAFRQAKVLSGNEKLTMVAFFAELAKVAGGGDPTKKEIDQALGEVFVVQGGASPTLVL